MKPFNLEKAKEGAKLITRDGRAAKFIAHIPELPPDFQVVVLVDGCAFAGTYSVDGFVTKWSAPTQMDLFMAPETKTVYVNLWIGQAVGDVSDDSMAAYWYENRESAIFASANSEYCFKVAHPIEVEV